VENNFPSRSFPVADNNEGFLVSRTPDVKEGKNINFQCLSIETVWKGEILEATSFLPHHRH
jgi:hypothetical protein